MIPQDGPGQSAQADAAFQQRGLDREYVVEPKKMLLAHAMESEFERGGIAMDFFGGEGGKLGLAGVALKKFILRRDNIFDFRGVLGFLKGQRIDEDALVGDGAGHTLEFGELPVGSGQLP